MKTTVNSAVTTMILLATAIAVQASAPKPPKPQPDCSLYDPACPIILDSKTHHTAKRTPVLHADMICPWYYDICGSPLPVPAPPPPPPGPDCSKVRCY